MTTEDTRGREWRRKQARKHKRGNLSAMRAIFPTVMPISRTWESGMIHPFTRQGNSWMGEMRKDFKANKVMPQDPMEDEV